MKKGCDWKSPLLTFLTVVGSALQNASLNFWLLSFGAPTPWTSNRCAYLTFWSLILSLTLSPLFSNAPYSSPYFILIISSIAFLVVFGAVALGYALRAKCKHRPIDIPSLRKYGFSFFAIGFCVALNGFLIVFSAPAFRTPPLLQGILPNTGILWAILLTPLIVGKRNSPIPVLAWQPLLVIGLILAGAGLAISPLIRDLINGSTRFFSPGTSPIYVIEWSIIFALGFVPGVALNVFQEAFFKYRKRELSESEGFVGFVFFVFHLCVSSAHS